MADVIFMLYILKTWYTMPPTLPVLFTFFAFLALGVYAALGLKNKRSVLFLALGLVVLYLLCTPVSLNDLFGIGVYSTFVGGVASLVLLGCILGFAARSLRRKKGRISKKTSAIGGSFFMQ